MSVVNQMLRDLDRRQAGEQALYAQHVQPPASTRRGLWLACALAFMLVLAASYGALRYFDRPASVDSHVRDIQAPVAAIDTPRNDEAEAPSPSAPVVESVVVPTAPEKAPAVSQQIAAVETPATETPAAPQVQPEPSRPVVEPAPVLSTVPVDPAPTDVVANVERPAQTPQAAPAERDAGPTKIEVRPHTPADTADSEYRRAAALINRGRNEEARTALTQALELDPAHEAARQTLAVLLIDARANADAERLLAEGLRINPAQTNFAIVLARLHLDRGDDHGALQVLRAHADAAQANAEYGAFTAALLQRLDRHAEAIEAYRDVLKFAPNAGIWWVGLGRSYEATQQPAEAADAYAHARDTGTLRPAVAQFVEQKLQTLR